MHSTLSDNLPHLYRTKDQVEEGYEKEAKMIPCKKCNTNKKGKLCRVRIDRFPQVMEMRIEFGEGKGEGSEELTRSNVWRNMRVPRHLEWSKSLKMRYRFFGMIFLDPKVK